MSTTTLTDAEAEIAQKAVAGPWIAVLADRLGFVYDSVDDALENADDPDGEDGEFAISVIRGSALPNDRSGCRLRLPGTHHSGDKAYELDDVYLEDPTDETVGAVARLAQAQAMAAGLNAAAQENLTRRDFPAMTTQPNPPDSEPLTLAEREASHDPSLDHSSHSMQWVGDKCPECPDDEPANAGRPRRGNWR